MPLMPSSPDYKRDYSKNGEGKYQSQSKSKKDRARRNNARRKMLRLGKVSKGDGNDVHHVGGKTTSKNLAVKPASKNRSFSRTKNAGKKNLKD